MWTAREHKCQIWDETLMEGNREKVRTVSETKFQSRTSSPLNFFDEKSNEYNLGIWR